MAGHKIQDWVLMEEWWVAGKVEHRVHLYVDEADLMYDCHQARLEHVHNMDSDSTTLFGVLYCPMDHIAKEVLPRSDGGEGGKVIYFFHPPTSKGSHHGKAKTRPRHDTRQHG